MRIVYIADARSPIARNWINHFVENHHNITVISPYYCHSDDFPGVNLVHVPFRLNKSRLTLSGAGIDYKSRNFLPLFLSRVSKIGSSVNRLRNLIYWVEPLLLYRYTNTIRVLLKNIAPDFVHAMRIPFEGIFAASAVPPRIPLVISIWGNDLTLFASANPFVARQTKHTLERANALHTDCRRDAELAEQWGYQSCKPTVVLPGAGGIKTDLFYIDGNVIDIGIAKEIPVVINPRGFRDYVRNDTFFRAIPLVLQKHPKVLFVCSSMKGNPIAEKWISQLGIAQNIRLLPPIPHARMAEVFRLAQVTVSPSVHDGTPNSLLEAMACGCFPVAGDITSVREWIDDGVNGLLCDPSNPEDLAASIIRALEDEKLRKSARGLNIKLVSERAEYNQVMSRAEQFYTKVLKVRDESE